MSKKLDIFAAMKHDEVVAALKIIAETSQAVGISPSDLQELKSYTLIDIVPPSASSKKTTYVLTKKGRVMHKANSK